ncbi:MAG: hypothetical protein A2249_02925 [Candidatus Jacksonbacteria bacterium RIFOXYA2_FULL_44_7]|uniref:PIN domain-containing protein n=1 Tax=Candidatus Jacksonbacteria bacterium RIFCSPLOWO2_02_FULL_44_20 TaxID=1798460 RepID=A0A1G2A838_9BACT|nr:MAG: hypothetical protein A3H61_04525 [Candidatus Jacksonbacteria bacterium RIFCSPLOWO2_02_FULL_44_20]OGY77141.1 MAG: hypothetical protein A2249_02925 [Candidatus Jacksonbacteria bacterium RIFOXYA2_FULL_44_7]
MEKVLIDANFIIALLCSEDSCHAKAVSLSEELPQKQVQWVLNNAILYEILTVLSKRRVKPLARLFYQTVKQEGVVQFVYITHDIEEKAFIYFGRMRSNNISFFDCTLFATADAYNTKYIVSFDRHLRNKTAHTIIHAPNQLS